jgi:dolichol kinase
MKKEIFRKSFHLLFGIIFLALIFFLGTQVSFWIITTCFLIGLIISLLHKSKIKIPLFEKIIFSVEREHEKHLPGKAALFFFLATMILLYFFPNNKEIILIALAVQIFADTAAAIIGKKFGKHIIVSKNHYTKTLEGTLACFVVALIILFIFFPIEIALFCAIVATIIEFAPINDNLTIPIVLAIVLKLLL